MSREAATERAQAQPRARVRTELLVCSPWEAVNEAERRFCGDRLVSDAAAAEGIALAGRAAATRLDLESPGALPQRAAGCGAWVHHALGCHVDSRFAVVLAAGNAQQAVDHCLVGHYAAAALGRPALALLADAGAGRWEPVELFGELPEPLPAAADDPEAAVAAALEHASTVLGRRVAPFVWDGPRDATRVLLCCGSDRRAARAAALLRQAGVECAALGVAVVEPLPWRELAERLAGREVLFVEPAAGMGHGLHRWRALPGVRGSLVEADARALARVAAERFGLAGVRIEIGEAKKAWEVPRAGVAAPAAAWAEGLLRRVAQEIARAERKLEFDYTPARGGDPAVLALRPGEAEGGSAGELDAVVVAGELALVPSAVARLREGGSLVVTSSSGRGREELAALLYGRFGEMLESRRCAVLWVRPHPAPEPREEAWRAARTAGALLASHPSFARALGAETAEQFAARLGESPVGAALLEGVEALEPLPPPVGASEVRAERSTPPVLPDETGMGAGEWEVPLRIWHLTGEGAAWDGEPCQAEGLRPALVAALEDLTGRWRQYPLVLDEGRVPEPLAAVLGRALDELGDTGEGGAILREHLWRLCRAAERAAQDESQAPDALPLGEALSRAAERFLSELDLSAAGRAKLEGVLHRLAPSLPGTARVLPLGRRAALEAYAAIVREGLAARREAFAAKVRHLLHRVDDLLRTPSARAGESRSPEALARELGAPGEAWLDPRSLATRLPERGVKPMPASRRARLLEVREVLARFLEAQRQWPSVVFLASGDRETALPPGSLCVRHPDPLRAAAGCFDGHAETWGAVFRAVRIAELELDGRFDEALHEPLLARFGAPFFSREELALLPRVAVIAGERTLAEECLDALSALLRSGRPVHVLALEPVFGRTPRASWEALTSYDPGLGYLAVAHREAFVLSTGLDDVEGLLEGLERLAAATCPAVAVVHVPRPGAPLAEWLELSAAHRGRAAVHFLYDPQAGETWAERFELERNPELERPWPAGRIPCIAAGGTERTLEETFTFAHAAALDPAFRPHFRVIPPEAWSESQVPLAVYLDAPREVRRTQVPYIWVVDGTGRLARAVVSRDLAWAARDRRRAWKVFQELAGADNEHARRAADKARVEALAEAEAERRVLEERYAQELAELRDRAAEEAVERLLQALLSGEVPPLRERPEREAPPAPPPRRPAAEAPAEAHAPAPPAEEAEAQEQEEEEEEVLLAEPYIDSLLCTSCDDCININPRMFRYNENKQATIADPTAGTFEELVRAAEKCPARCIHPGAPRPDDPTVTPELIERAKKFA